MQVKQKVYTPIKMIKGVINSKQKDGNYYHAKNIRLRTHTEKATGGFVYEKGNDLSITLPIVTMNYTNTSLDYISNGVSVSLKYRPVQNIYPRAEIESDFYNGQKSNDNGPQIIIGYSITKNGLILFTTDSNGFDCIWYVEDDNSDSGIKNIELKYCRNMGFNINNPIEAHSNYENENIDKTYWIDGIHQNRSINILNSELVNAELSTIDMVGDFDLSQPKILETFQGGTHTAGMIQYAYNLYRINGSQTKISPLSELVALDKGVQGGGALNEIVSETVSIQIDDLDTSYTNIKLYAIKYTSFNQSPSVSVILDKSIPSNGSVQHYDDGIILLPISNETFLFLGGDVIIPKTMEVKNNRMFFANYTEKSYMLVNKQGEDVSSGCRAFSYDNTQNTKIAELMVKASDGSQKPSGTIFEFSSSAPLKPYENFSCINVDYRKYIYNSDGNIGGTGEFLKYTLKRSQIGVNGFTQQDSEGRFFKDGELYRISIQFYNKYGDVSTPKWIADFVTQQISNGNLSGYYGTIEIELLPAFYTWLNNVEDDLKPVGYKILRAERTLKDKTILAQGIINGMIAIAPQGRERYPDYSQSAKDFCHNKAVKIPSMMRTFGNDLCPMFGNKTYFGIPDKRHPLGIPRYGDHGAYIGNISEIYGFRDTDDAEKMSYQFNKLMQFNCPEIEFELLSMINSSNLTVIGSLASSSNNWWAKEFDNTTKTVVQEGKTNGVISPYDINSTDIVNTLGNAQNIQDHGIIGPSGLNTTSDHHQFYREYNGPFTFKKKDYPLYGKPEIAERGQGIKRYNGDADLKYTNSVEPLSSDNGQNVDAIRATGVKQVNSYSCRSAFFALGSQFDSTQDRKAIEDIYSEMGFTDTKGVILTEFKLDEILLYVGSLYGGNSYEDKKRTNYIEIGSYKDILETTNEIKSPGDIFVANYRFERISSNGVEPKDATQSVLTEIVSFTTETSIDSNRRNDLSVNDWDNKFEPSYEEYHKYNRVYSQESTFIYRRDNEYTFTAVNNFETSIVATSEKIPNENIDSWTNILVNEQMNIDGRYGAINALISFEDEVFAFQDRAIARISILPRVQVAGNDGEMVQLGTGALFNDYKYLTTKSGSINKWAIVASERALYYVDALNKSFLSLSRGGYKNVSDEEEFHAEFQEIIELPLVKNDNPIKHQGISLGFDQITKDVYLSIFKQEGCTTLCYNEDEQGFTSYYDYDSPIYIFNKKEFLTVSPLDGGLVYKHFTGKYNVFYGQLKESIYSIVLAPEPMTECIFNNVEYNCITRDQEENEVVKTWETVRLYNEFQDSGVRSLIEKDNIRKKNRQFKLTLPRQEKSRNRIRNNWAILELKSSNIESNSMLMNDIILYYTPNYLTVL